MNRRQLLGRAAATATLAGATSIGPAWFARAVAQQATPGESPYGPLSTTPDGNGLLLPAGFSSRIVGRALTPVQGTAHLWHIFPDGSATFPTGDGGWILVSNSEAPFDVGLPVPPLALGGVSAIRFAADGSIVDAYRILSGSRVNCAGGVTPWGTWLSCEEWEASGLAYDAGKVWECDPAGTADAVHRPLLGHFKHEMAALDPDGHRVYLTEDKRDGRFYRFTPTTWGDLSAGVLEAAQRQGDGHVAWVPVPDPACSGGVSTRQQAVGSTGFDGGEGCLFDSGKVYVSTKGDDRIWVYDTATETMDVLYDAALYADPVLSGVDNIGIHRPSGDLVIAEDGGNMEVVLITRDLVVAPLVRATGPQHGQDLVPGIPTESEISGLAFDPDGTRLYFNSQRAYVFGVTYEVTGPFRGSPLDPALAATAAPAAAPGAGASAATSAAAGAESAQGARRTLPATGGSAGIGLAGAAAATVAATALRVRRRGAAGV